MRIYLYLKAGFRLFNFIGIYISSGIPLLEKINGDTPPQLLPRSQLPHNLSLENHFIKFLYFVLPEHNELGTI